MVAPQPYSLIDRKIIAASEILRLAAWAILGLVAQTHAINVLRNENKIVYIVKYEIYV